MSVKIRLRRIGRKKQPSYRLVVTDTAAPRDGAYVAAVGFYNPRSQPAELRLDLESVDRWVAQGAQMSDTVRSLVRKARRGGDATVELVPLKGHPMAKPEVVGEAAAERAPAPARPGSRGRAAQTATTTAPEPAVAEAAAPAEAAADTQAEPTAEASPAAAEPASEAPAVEAPADEAEPKE